MAPFRFEPYGVAEVRTGMSVQELAPISEFRASEAHPIWCTTQGDLCSCFVSDLSQKFANFLGVGRLESRLLKNAIACKTTYLEYKRSRRSITMPLYEFTHSLEHLTTAELMAVLADDKDAAIRAAESAAPLRIEASNRLYEYNLRTALKDRQIRVEAAGIHESSNHFAHFSGWVYDETLSISGVWLATRSCWAERETPYAHITPDSARGIWLEETKYTILEPSTPTVS